MDKQLTADDFKQSLNSHIQGKAEEIRARYGPCIGSGELAAMMEDRSAVRYPCEIVFEAEPLLEGEFAHPLPNADDPEAGFKICIHPFFRSEERSAVRYPCEIVFEAEPLLEGEFAHPLPNADDPEAGFKICIHPFFSTQPEKVPYLVLYQLVLVNYGPFASSDDAETFGAGVLGISKEEYYQSLCEMADQLGPCPTGC